MTFSEKPLKRIVIFVIGWIILWFFLFEFIIPGNRFFPSPEVLVKSFPALWKAYELPVNILSSIAVVYTSLITGFLLVKVFRIAFLNEKGFVFYFISSLEWFSEFVPGIIIGILLIFWYPQSDYTEFIFAFLTVFSSISLGVVRLKNRVNKNYVQAAKSLGAGPRDVSLVEFNSIIPPLMNSIFGLHFYLWTMLLVFEFINESYGIGAVLRQSFEYKDISAFVAAFLITGFIIYLGTLLLKFLRNKFFFWNA